MGRDIRVLCCLALAAAGALATQSEKAVEAVRNYDAGWAKIELLGVCKASETKASCWDANGENAPKLAEEFKASFEDSDYRHIPLKLGRKTRVAVFRTTRAPSEDDLVGLSTSFSSGLGSSFEWSAQKQREYRDPVQFKTVVFLAKPAEREAQAIANLRYTSTRSDRLRLAEGESMEYQGIRFTIRRVSATDSIPPYTQGLETTKWIIAMTAERGNRTLELYWTAIGQDSLAIRGVDRSGMPFFAPNGVPQSDPGQLDANGKPVVPQKLPAVLSTGYGFYPAGDDYYLYTNIDPSKIKELFVRGTSNLKVTIRGIPLEPR